jgi:hypothetical protein
MRSEVFSNLTSLALHVYMREMLSIIKLTFSHTCHQKPKMEDQRMELASESHAVVVNGIYHCARKVQMGCPVGYFGAVE